MEMQQRILEQARKLFFRYGLKSITMNEIANDLGVSKKTLYEFFPAKKDIINKITRDFLNEQSEEHAKILKECKDAVDELLRLMDSILHVFESLDVRVIYDMQRYYPEAWNIFLNHKEETILRDITMNLQRGIDEGLFRKNINVDIIARMRLELVQMAMDPKCFPPELFDIKDVHQQMLLQYVNGLCTKNGHELINTYLKESKTKNVVQ